MPRMTEYPHGQFCWVDFASHDFDRAATFYGTVFGWQIVDADTQGGPRYGMFTHDGATIGGLGELSDAMKAAGMPPVWNLYVKVDDAAVTLEKVEAQGGKVTMPLMQIFDAGRMAFFQDPTGGNLAIWEPIEHHGAELVGEPGSACWFELATRDREGAAAFFAAVFGWEAVDNPVAPAGYSTLKNGAHDNAGVLQMTEEWGDMPPHWTVYFSVLDAANTCETIRNAGGQVHFGPFDAPVGKIAVCADDQGAVFHVIELAAAASGEG